MLQYISAGHFISDGDWIHPRRQIDTYEIIYVLKGTVYIQENDSFYTLKEKQVLLLEPGKLHQGNQYSRDVEFFWLHFADTSAPRFKNFTPRNSYEVESQLKRLLHIANTPGYAEGSLDAAAVLLVNELSFQHSTAGFDGSTFPAQILEYIHNHGDEPLTVSQVAAHFGYTPGYISKLFYAKYHIGFKQFMERERLKVAKSLLLTTALSIKQIAARLHYPEEKNFIKFFTYHEKISPAKYRRLYFNTHQNNK